LFRLPDGVTPVHLARNQALSNVCVPTTIISLGQTTHDENNKMNNNNNNSSSSMMILGGVTSLAAAVGGSLFQ